MWWLWIGGLWILQFRSYVTAKRALKRLRVKDAEFDELRQLHELITSQALMTLQIMKRAMLDQPNDLGVQRAMDAFLIFDKQMQDNMDLAEERGWFTIERDDKEPDEE